MPLNSDISYLKEDNMAKEVKKEVKKEEVKAVKEIKPIKNDIPVGLRVDAPKISVKQM